MDRKKKRVRIFAYTKVNLGDDLFIKILCERYPDITFYLFADKDTKAVFKGCRNLRCYDYLWPRRMLRVLRMLGINNVNDDQLLGKLFKLDAYVYIGGSIFIQGNFWRNALQNRYAQLIEGKPNFVMGCNFGPFESKEYLSSYRRLFQNYTDVCFRDEYSYQLFKEMKNTRHGSDIVFGIAGLPQPEVIKAVGISVINLELPARKEIVQYAKQYDAKMAEIAEVFIRKGYDIYFYSFCKAEGDEEAIERIVELISPTLRKQSFSHYYRGDLDAVLQSLASMEYIIATRFHAMILGMVLKKPTYPIIYDEKMKHVLEDMKFAGNYSLLSEVGDIIPQEMIVDFTENAQDVTRQVADSHKHFTAFEKYINEN
ncbi:polysaccharide pyruvyl transferase family protein [Azotosporobacter soli]|uniref:polysaccharide pyruvyl transferase family protein n=1 Tax=Azotosporobacter soli TaxID=3055040 RepID=UPI0031FF13CD